MSRKNKPPRRDEDAKNDSAAFERGAMPVGAYLPGCHNHKVSKALALALTLWPFTEDAMASVLHALMGGAPEDVASSLFHSMTAQNMRISLMQTLLHGPRTNRDKSEVFDRIIAEFNRLSIVRNGFAHMYWYTHENGDVYLCRSKKSSARAFHYGDRIDAAGIAEFTRDCQALEKLILETLLAAPPS
ncbi:MAG: hypothetical protein KF895_03195 [Parvibaculum sp.]|nr:hypothetical protein [Parvibaculum sp.]